MRSTLPHTLSLDQVRLALEASEGSTRVMLEVLFGTGVRVSELVALTWDCIDFEEQTARVNKGKGNKDRIVRFGAPCRDALLRYRSELETDVAYVPAKEEQARKIEDTEGPNHPRGQVNHRVFPLSTQAVEARFRSLSRKVGFRVWPHGLRHSMATTMMANGADLISIMMLLGHVSVKSTEVYLHVDPNVEERGRWVADAMGQVRGQITREHLRKTLTGVRWA